MRRLVFGCWLMTLLLVLPVSLRAERYALLVGVKNYGKSSGLNPLQYTEKDVEELGALLIQSGYRATNVTVMTQVRGANDPDLNPTLDRIQHQLKLLLGGLQTGDSVIVAFAGHGVQFKEDQKNYFCPGDANLLERKNLLDFQEVYASLKKCEATYKLLLSDACRNDPFDKTARAGAPSVTRPTPPTPEGTTVALFSCEAGEFSWEDEKFGHGVFFHFLIQGLKGDADRKSPTDPQAIANANGTVELHELIAYTQTNVKDFVRAEKSTSQRPSLRTDSNNFQLLNRFPLVSIPENKFTGTKAGEVRTLGTVKFCWCPPGSFQMGSPASEKDRSDNESQVSVRLTRGFWMGQTEVTQGLWEAVMDTTPWKGERYVKEGSSYPATYVSWEDATEFCGKLTAKGHSEGWLPKDWKFDLPTEAQWEYAGRAGTETAYSFGDDESKLSEYAWFDKNAWDVNERYAHLVGQKKANPWGLYDMHGNVYEWCRDWYAEKLPGGTDPEALEGAGSRVNRGGSWSIVGGLCRSAFRYRDAPDNRNSILGFRLSCSSIR